jgi:hypothetical protein
MIVIVAPPDDFHAIVAKQVISHRFGERCSIVDLDSFPSAMSLSLAIDARNQRASIRHGDDVIDRSQVTCVWWRRPRLLANRDLPTTRREHEIHAFVRRESASLVTSFFGSQLGRVVNRPDRQDAAVCKGTQLVTAARLELPIPDTIISNDPQQIADFAARHPSCIQKILTRFDPALLPTSQLLDDDLQQPKCIQASPLIVQETLEPGYDVRVNIFGPDVHAAVKPVTSIDGRQDVGLWSAHELPADLASKLRTLLDELGLDYGCIDLRLTHAGDYHFLEVNPSGQFLMVERDTGQDLTESLCRLLLTTRTDGLLRASSIPQSEPIVPTGVGR